MSEHFIPHDNTGWPAGLTPDSYVKCIMGNGETVFGDAKDIDWQHETDPVVSFAVLRFVPLVVH